MFRSYALKSTAIMTLIDLFFNCVVLYILGSLLRLSFEQSVAYFKAAALLYLCKTVLWLGLRIPLMRPIDRWRRRGSPCGDNDPALIRAIYYFPFDFTIFYGLLVGAYYAVLAVWMVYGQLRLGEELLVSGLVLAGAICAGAIALGVPVNLLLTAKFSRRLAERKAKAFHEIPGKELSLGVKMATIALALGCAPSLLLFSVQRLIQDQGLFEEARRTASGVMRGLAKEKPSEFSHWVISERANPFLVTHNEIRFFGASRPSSETLELITVGAARSSSYEHLDRQHRYVLKMSPRGGGSVHGVLVGVSDPENHWLAMSIVIVLACLWPLVAATLLVRTIVGPISHVGSTFHRIIGRGRTEESDRVPLFYKDEVGRLAFNANQTIDILTEARQELEITASSLAQKNQELEQAYRTKGEFLANMSHELRTPLNAIIGFSRLMGRKLSDSIPERQRRNLELIEQSGEQLLSLVNDLLDFEKIEAGKLTVRRQAVELEPLLEGLEETLKPLAAERGLEFELKTCGLPETIPSDKERLRQILSNLVTNAFKYSDRGTVQLKGFQQDGEVVFQIVDQGIGMSAEQLEKIFDPFHQVDATETRERSGVGLGLAIVSRLVELLQASIAVTSTPGGGSTFEVRFPLTLAGDACLETISSGQAPAAALAPGGLAVVEDDLHSAQLLEQMLADLEIKARFYASEESAFPELVSLPPAVLVLDLSLSQGDGWSLLQRLRDNPVGKKIAVFVYSAAELSPGEQVRLDELEAVFIPKRGRESLARLVEEISSRATNG